MPSPAQKVWTNTYILEPLLHELSLCDCGDRHGLRDVVPLMRLNEVTFQLISKMLYGQVSEKSPRHWPGKDGEGLSLAEYMQSKDASEPRIKFYHSLVTELHIRLPNLKDLNVGPLEVLYPALSTLVCGIGSWESYDDKSDDSDDSSNTSSEPATWVNSEPGETPFLARLRKRESGSFDLEMRISVAPLGFEETERLMDFRSEMVSMRLTKLELVDNWAPVEDVMDILCGKAEGMYEFDASGVRELHIAGSDCTDADLDKIAERYPALEILSFATRLMTLETFQSVVTLFPMLKWLEVQTETRTAWQMSLEETLREAARLPHLAHLAIPFNIDDEPMITDEGDLASLVTHPLTAPPPLTLGSLKLYVISSSHLDVIDDKPRVTTLEMSIRLARLVGLDCDVVFEGIEATDDGSIKSLDEAHADDSDSDSDSCDGGRATYLESTVYAKELKTGWQMVKDLIKVTRQPGFVGVAKPRVGWSQLARDQ